MNFVQPIRDIEEIREIRRYLRDKSYRNYMLFVTGINGGLRISDILKLRVLDTKRPYFSLVEMKTGKVKRIEITPGLQRELKEYASDTEDHENSFKCREGNSKSIGRSVE